MYNLICSYLLELVKLLPWAIALRIIFDAIRNYIFKN